MADKTVKFPRTLPVWRRVAFGSITALSGESARSSTQNEKLLKNISSLSSESIAYFTLLSPLVVTEDRPDQYSLVAGINTYFVCRQRLAWDEEVWVVQLTSSWKSHFGRLAFVSQKFLQLLCADADPIESVIALLDELERAQNDGESADAQMVLTLLGSGLNSDRKIIDSFSVSRATMMRRLAHGNRK